MSIGCHFFHFSGFYKKSFTSRIEIIVMKLGGVDFRGSL